MDREGYFCLGRITKVHGLKGALQVVFDTQSPDDYLDLESVFVEYKQRLVPFFIEDFFLQGSGKGVLKLEELDTIDQAKNYLNSPLYIKEDEISEEDLEAREIMEVIGYTVIDQNMGKLGTVIDYYEKTGQDLLAFDYQGQEILLPVNEDLILEINPEEQMVRTNLPEGLLDIYLSTDKSKDNHED